MDMPQHTLQPAPAAEPKTANANPQKTPTPNMPKWELRLFRPGALPPQLAASGGFDAQRTDVYLVTPGMGGVGVKVRDFRADMLSVAQSSQPDAFAAGAGAGAGAGVVFVSD